MEFALAPTAAGGLPSRDQVQRFIAAHRTKPKATRTKALRGSVADRAFRLELKDGDTHDAVLEWAKALVALVTKHKNLPVAHLGLVAR